MIKVIVGKNHISIEGHADYEVAGKDIVCAAVSATVLTTVRAILRFGKTIHYQEKKDALEIEILKKDQPTKILLDNMISALEELEENYGKYIKIIFKEV